MDFAPACPEANQTRSNSSPGRVGAGGEAEGL